MLNYRKLDKFSLPSTPNHFFTDSFSDTKSNLIKTIVLVNFFFLALSSVGLKGIQSVRRGEVRRQKDNRIKTVYKLLLCHISREITDKVGKIFRCRVYDGVRRDSARICRRS